MSQAGALEETGVNPGIPLIFVTDSGNATAIANIIEILGGVGIATSASGNIITITSIATPSVVSWDRTFAVMGA